MNTWTSSQCFFHCPNFQGECSSLPHRSAISLPVLSPHPTAQPSWSHVSALRAFCSVTILFPKITKSDALLKQVPTHSFILLFHIFKGWTSSGNTMFPAFTLCYAACVSHNVCWTHIWKGRISTHFFAGFSAISLTSSVCLMLVKYVSLFVSTRDKDSLGMKKWKPRPNLANVLPIQSLRASSYNWFKDHIRFLQSIHESLPPFTEKAWQVRSLFPILHHNHRGTCSQGFLSSTSGAPSETSPDALHVYWARPVLGIYSIWSWIQYQSPWKSGGGHQIWSVGTPYCVSCQNLFLETENVPPVVLLCQWHEFLSVLSKFYYNYK